MRATHIVALLVALGLGLARPLPLHAQESEASESGSGADPALREYYRALAERRLLARETGSLVELRVIVRRGEEHVFEQRWDEAVLVLFEAVESPRFSDFDGTEEMGDAEFMLAGALSELGALRTAFRVIERILARGPQDPYFGPAFRRAIDLALAGADLEGTLGTLETVAASYSLSPDSENELRYLRGRVAYDARDDGAAEAAFAAVTRRSRFYANAQYLRGYIALRGGHLDTAEDRFCSIATTSDTARYTFYVDRRYFEIRDLTWLALGRAAHEGGRSEDAFYYYFQVPNDSARVAEALFEGAWAMYEGGDNETAVDLLDQLEARFPSSPFVDEAALLRGYVHLGRCEFEEADRLFVQFQDRFQTLRAELDRILESPSRRARIVEELLDAERRELDAAPPPPEGAVLPEADLRTTLLGLLQVEPGFYRLYAEIRSLDAEAARAASLADQLGAMEWRLRGSDAPEAATAEADSAEDEAATLARDLENARQAVRALTEQLDAMRVAGAPADRLRELDQTIRGFGDRIEDLEQRLRETLAQAARSATSTGEATDIEAMLRRDQHRAGTIPARAASLRARMIGAASTAAGRSLEQLRDRLGSSLRRARIGRIDAVMGSKRRIELQIQSLAAGRFPPELQDPLRIQGLLRDDEEYWPFEGEYWADEFEQDESDDELDEEGIEADRDLDPDLGDAIDQSEGGEGGAADEGFADDGDGSDS